MIIKTRIIKYIKKNYINKYDKNNNSSNYKEPDINNDDFRNNNTKNDDDLNYKKNNNNKINNNRNKANFIQNNNNINYKGNNNVGNITKKKSSSVKMNKYSLTYFCFLITNYMKKASYLMCVYEIANFQKTYEKNLALKLLFMIIKKRIIFYKIKFFHRFKKINKYLIKYKKTNNTNSNTNHTNNNSSYMQNRPQYNRRIYKK